jgi:hypothetical protein
MLFFQLQNDMTCHAIYRQKARTKRKDIGGSDRLTAVCQRVKRKWYSPPIVVFVKGSLYFRNEVCSPSPALMSTITAISVPINGTVCLPFTILFLLGMMPDEILSLS